MRGRGDVRDGSGVAHLEQEPSGSLGKLILKDDCGKWTCLAWSNWRFMEASGSGLGRSDQLIRCAFTQNNFWDRRASGPRLFGQEACACIIEQAQL